MSTVLNVPDMHCEMCVKRITDSLTKANLKFSVSLADKTVTVDGPAGDVSTAVTELDDLGFPATAK